jgi:hypothetical protein
MICLVSGDAIILCIVKYNIIIFDEVTHDVAADLPRRIRKYRPVLKA